jgi:tRNA pseudouridine55 synthase
LRKELRQRSIGHAGTLDPLATGVLVVAIGEATKLISHLQSDDKRYEVTIALGAETDSLDADGEITETAAVPTLDKAAVEEALRSFIGRHPQQAPKLSALKVGGTPLHRRARRGETVEAPVRQVELHEATVEEVSGDTLRLSLHCGKGFYVRSLARDLARALGTRGHVKKLRRTANGAFTLEHALRAEDVRAEAIGDRLISLKEACGFLTRVDLTDQGVADARHGRPIRPEAIRGQTWKMGRPNESLALFGPDGEPVALGRRVGEGIRVVRGFTDSVSDVVSR